LPAPLSFFYIGYGRPELAFPDNCAGNRYPGLQQPKRKAGKLALTWPPSFFYFVSKLVDRTEARIILTLIRIFSGMYIEVGGP